ncbi:MAG TPA: polysaccharide pyruvyl transferase family protein [Thermoleophilaceae bacterium]|jgi:colanic acid/amylovoran biosynthesis protein
MRPGPDGDPFRVVIDPGSHHVLNLGDVAMLQVALDRLGELWPDAHLDVLTTDPDALARHCPRARPLPAAGRYELVGAAGPPGDAARAYLEALEAADLLVVAGRGGVCDAFLGESLEILDELEAALSRGTPVALVGHGIGPVRDAALAARAASVLPRASLVAVRERRIAVPLLERLGVAPERIVVTGDDAIEPAWAARPAERSPTGIGLSLRATAYTGLAEAELAAVERAVRAAAARHRSEVVPVPISLYPSDAEAETVARVAGAAAAGRDAEAETASEPPAAEPRTVEAAIAAAGRCRVVVAGSYHAAVFALAQGVPAVGIAGSPYYSAKLLGLREQVGGRMDVEPAGGRMLEERLGTAIDAAWDMPAGEREELVEAAERQVAAGRAAYERLASAL